MKVDYVTGRRKENEQENMSALFLLNLDNIKNIDDRLLLEGRPSRAEDTTKAECIIWRLKNEPFDEQDEISVHLKYFDY
nr:hypothetical protein HmN_000276200 [Hymenolepis microstoma]